MFIVPIVVGDWQTNCYVLSPGEPDADGPQPAVIIDPGVDAEPAVRQVLDQHCLIPEAFLCTHGHFDHVCDAAKLANDFGVPVWLHPDDQPMITEPVRGLGPGSEPIIEQIAGSLTLPAPTDMRDMVDGEVLTVAGIDFELIHAPGHTPGSTVLRIDAQGQPLAFTGDVLFAGTMGRVDLPGGSMAQMKETLNRLTVMIDPKTGILPGHGQSTTMARELQTNPYLSKEAPC